MERNPYVRLTRAHINMEAKTQILQTFKLTGRVDTSNVFKFRRGTNGKFALDEIVEPPTYYNGSSNALSPPQNSTVNEDFIAETPDMYYTKCISKTREKNRKYDKEGVTHKKHSRNNNVEKDAPDNFPFEQDAIANENENEDIFSEIDIENADIKKSRTISKRKPTGSRRKGKYMTNGNESDGVRSELYNPIQDLSNLNNENLRNGNVENNVPTNVPVEEDLISNEYENDNLIIYDVVDLNKKRTTIKRKQTANKNENKPKRKYTNSNKKIVQSVTAAEKFDKYPPQSHSNNNRQVNDCPESIIVERDTPDKSPEQMNPDIENPIFSVENIKNGLNRVPVACFVELFQERQFFEKLKKMNEEILKAIIQTHNEK